MQMDKPNSRSNESESLEASSLSITLKAENYCFKIYTNREVFSLNGYNAQAPDGD